MRYLTRSVRRRVERPIGAFQRRFQAWLHTTKKPPDLHACARTIQRFYRRLHCVDPLTLDRIKSPVFTVVDADGKERHFGARTLAAFIESSGDFRNPLTRVPFLQVEILRLARLSGNIEILQRNQLEMERRARIEEESLSLFFESEMETHLDQLFDVLSRGASLFQGHHVRLALITSHLVRVHFPQIFLTIARAAQANSSLADRLVSMLEDRVAADEISDPNDQVRVLFHYMCNQFLTDMRTHLSHNTFIGSDVATLDLGQGMRMEIHIGA